MRTHFFFGLVFAVGGALALLACGGAGSSSSTAPSNSTGGGASMTIAIVSSNGSAAFNPNPLSATSGDMVAFKNNDTTTHHIVMNDGSADFGDIAPGATSRAVAATSKAGNYHCTIHPTMVGTINGDKATDSPPCTNPGYCD